MDHHPKVGEIWKWTNNGRFKTAEETYSVFIIEKLSDFYLRYIVMRLGTNKEYLVEFQEPTLNDYWSKVQ